MRYLRLFFLARRRAGLYVKMEASKPQSYVRFWWRGGKDAVYFFLITRQS